MPDVKKSIANTLNVYQLIYIGSKLPVFNIQLCNITVFFYFSFTGLFWHLPCQRLFVSKYAGCELCVWDVMSLQEGSLGQKRRNKDIWPLHGGGFPLC